MGLVTALAVPALGPILGRRSLDAAAAVLAGEMARARQEAVARSRHVGIAFERAPEGDRYAVYLDGGRSGISAMEIAAGTDALLRGPVDLSSSFSGVRLGIPGPSRIPKVPPSRGVLSPGDDPIQFGGSDIVSFSRTGESSSGAVYLTDRRGGLRAVVVYGRTGRIRVWVYVPEMQRWRQ
jgi:Tfp pilus assembly protein FimT